ncbi:MAG: Uncharacterized protein FD141_812 [Fusobacteria bacterium]|nr:MAG: Uncharacterized protein FD141_812 [Fusobacteriota bacterium]KAF0228522.1 MAG: hypothetical protein FD182_778 [Fusobacteriota bacterium]
MKETNLYEGVKKYFESLGFLVRAEVKDIDVCAIKEDLLIGVELKNNLTVDLLVQGTLRQKVCDLVYIAVPRPKRFKKNREFSNTLHLLRRLELGLLFVDVDKGMAEEILEPAYFNLDKARSALVNRRKALLKEIKGRSLSLNQGGSSRTRLMTAYREESLKAVAILLEKGSVAPKDLKELGLKSTILRDNYYGWFKKIARGTYVLDDCKSDDYECYRDYISEFRSVLFLM